MVTPALSKTVGPFLILASRRASEPQPVVATNATTVHAAEADVMRPWTTGSPRTVPERFDRRPNHRADARTGQAGSGSPGLDRRFRRTCPVPRATDWRPVSGGGYYPPDRGRPVRRGARLTSRAWSASARSPSTPLIARRPVLTFTATLARPSIGTVVALAGAVTSAPRSVAPAG